MLYELKTIAGHFLGLSVIGAIAGCAGFALDDVASVTQAGITTAHVEPVIGDADDRALGTEYAFVFGKEYEHLAITLDWSEGETARPIVRVTARGVGAFVGQAAAAQATVAVQKALAELGVELGDDATAITDAITRALSPAALVPDD